MSQHNSNISVEEFILDSLSKLDVGNKSSIPYINHCIQGICNKLHCQGRIDLYRFSIVDRYLYIDYLADGTINTKQIKFNLDDLTILLYNARYIINS